MQKYKQMQINNNIFITTTILKVNTYSYIAPQLADIS